MTVVSRDDIDLDLLADATYSAVFSDACDQLGFREQTMSPGIAPIGGARRIVGWARPFTVQAVEAIPEKPYRNEISFIDSLGVDEVPVGVSTQPVAAWGELFSAAARGRGARGVVLDGYIRDAAKIRALDFPVSARGTRPTDLLGRVTFDDGAESAQVGGVVVTGGDLVVADDDGVAIVPRSIVDEVVQYALTKAGTENEALHLLIDGGKLADVWERHRVM